MSRRLAEGLAATLDELMSQVMTGSPGTRPRLESARGHLLGVITIVVTGRRGAGKTTVVNELLSERLGEVGYSAEDRPAQFFASEVENTPTWGVATLVPAPVARGRRIVELPEHMTADLLPRESWAGGPPDVLVHVTRQPLRSDELVLLDRVQGEWSLGPLQTLVVGTHQPPHGFIATSREALPLQIEAVERLLDARRCHEVMQLLASLAARSDDRGWADRLVDDLERLSLTPQGHVLRERWALEVCLSRQADVPSTLRDAVVRLTVGPRTATPHGREALLAQAGHWRTQISLLPPLAAEVARVVTRKLQLDAAATHDDARPAEGVQP